MRGIALHQRVLHASLGTRLPATRCYSRWTSDDMSGSEDYSRRRRNSQHQTQSSRFTTDDMEAEDEGSAEKPKPKGPEVHHEPEDHQEYRHRKQTARFRAPREEVQQDEKDKRLFGPQDRTPINYFTLPKKVWSLQGNPVEPTEEALDKAQKAIEDLERKAFGTLERTETKDGEVVYTRPRPDSLSNREMKDDEIFEISPSLMDLDSWNNPNVRMFDASDEEAQMYKWSKKPRWQGVKEFVNDLEARVTESQASFDTLLKEKYNPSRVTAWDVVSVALRGVDPEPTPSAPLKTLVEEASRRLDPRLGTSLTQIIRKNGIPEKAQREDTLLIDWMLMRRRLLAREEKSKEGGISPAEHPILDPEEWMLIHKRLLAKEEKRQSATVPVLEAESCESITGLRRGIIGMLDARLTYSSMIESTCQTKTERRLFTLLDKIHDVGRELSTDNTPGSSEISGFLSLLASLLDRLPENDAKSRLQISWLGLRLAVTYDAATTLHYLEQSLRFSSTFENDKSDAPAWEDLNFIIQKINSNIRNDASWDLAKPDLASHILRSYTGSSYDGYLSTEAMSLRGIIIQNLKAHLNQAKDKKEVNRWLQTYDSYLEGLGSLGAARSIWAEWASLGELGEVEIYRQQPEDKQQLSASFCKATGMLLKGHRGSSGMDECALESAISGPLEGWLKVLKKQGWTETNPPRQHDASREDMSAVSGA